jgi:hypothetical protein
MGIKNLNKYIYDKCKNKIDINASLNKLSGKKIVIDTSIYLYKFTSTNTLIEHFYTMIILFKKYNIIPLFIFDGKSPTEKKELLVQRKLEKDKCINELKNLKLEYDSLDTHNYELLMRINKLKLQSTTINKCIIKKTKNLFDAFGVMYLTAENEADNLCSYLVSQKIAYACLSEDTDMFVYGCDIIIKNLNLDNHTVDICNISYIIKFLKISMDNFKNICILAGTDYNINNTINYSIYELFNMYNKYINNYININNSSFIEWLVENNNIKIQLNIINDTKKIYDLSNFIFNNKINIKYNNMDKTQLKSILKKDRFYYP